MAAQPSWEPDRSPGSSPPRAPSPRSPYAGAPGPQKNVVELPAGHSAEVKPPITAGDFVGKYFAQDSLEFLRWAARYFRDDNAALCILLLMMGSQEVGGRVALKQTEIAEELMMNPTQVSRALSKLRQLGLVFSPKRGTFQLQPSVTLRGGYKVINRPVPGSSTKPVRVPVEQLSLLNDFVLDPDVPEEFRDMALPGAALPDPPTRRKRTKRTEKPEA